MLRVGGGYMVRVFDKYWCVDSVDDLCDLYDLL